MEDPSFFGEVLPLDSRLDEVDDDFITPVDQSYDVIVEKRQPVDDVESVIVAVGKHAYEFARCVLLQSDGEEPSREIGRLLLRPSISTNDRQYLISTRYMSKRRLSVVCLSSVPPEEYGYDIWSELMKCYTKLPTCVITMSSQASRLYIKPRTAPNVHIRVLANKKAQERWRHLNDIWEKIQPPNVLSGVCAAAVSWGLRENVPACALVSYFETTDRVDSIACASRFGEICSINDQGLDVSALVSSPQHAVDALTRRSTLSDPQTYA